MAVNTDLDQEEKEVLDALPRNGAYLPRSLLLGGGRDKAPFLDSFYHGPLLYSVNYEKKTLFFPPLFGFCLFVFHFSGAFHGHTSATGREVIHGCVSFVLGLHVHAQHNLSPPPPHPKSVEFIISTKPQNTVGHIRVSFKICLTVLNQNLSHLPSGFVHSGGHCITQNTNICHKANCFPSGSQNLFEGSPLSNRKSQKELKDNPVLPPFKGDPECVG